MYKIILVRTIRTNASEAGNDVRHPIEDLTRRIQIWIIAMGHQGAIPKIAELVVFENRCSRHYRHTQSESNYHDPGNVTEAAIWRQIRAAAQ